MKKIWLLIIVSFGLIISACKKESGCTPVSPDAEQSSIKEFTVKNNIILKKDSKGIYYNIVDSGYGIAPSRNSKISIQYKGSFLNNLVFDSTTAPQTFALSELIEGFQSALPLIKKGGKIQLVIPSVFAYGCTGNSNLHVPPNTVLFFDVDLVDVQ